MTIETEVEKYSNIVALFKSLFSSLKGAWLAGLLKTGELFLWHKDLDDLKTIPAVEESRKAVIAANGRNIHLIVLLKFNCCS